MKTETETETETETTNFCTQATNFAQRISTGMHQGSLMLQHFENSTVASGFSSMHCLSNER